MESGCIPVYPVLFTSLKKHCYGCRVVLMCPLCSSASGHNSMKCNRGCKSHPRNWVDIHTESCAAAAVTLLSVSELADLNLDGIHLIHVAVAAVTAMPTSPKQYVGK